jgi:hypothetical protein
LQANFYEDEERYRAMIKKSGLDEDILFLTTSPGMMK